MSEEKSGSTKKIEMVCKIWIKWVPEKKQFGVKANTYFGEENIYYADEVDFNTIFPARPRPGITRMNISTQGVAMQVVQPFTISGEFENQNGKNVMVLRLHHQT